MKWTIKSRLSKTIVLVTLVTAMAGGWYWYSNASQEPQDTNQPITVIRGNIEEVVTSQGKLEAKQYVDVGTQVSGQLKTIHVDIGDTVNQGPASRRNRPARLPGPGGSGRSPAE